MKIRKSKRSGVMVALLAIVLPAMLMLAAFAINVAYMELTRTELQIATDAAARAAGRRLVLSGDKTAAINEGVDAASRNSVGGSSLALAGRNFDFGKCTRDGLSTRYDFVSTTGQANAVQVTTDRTVNLFFSRLTSVNDFSTNQRGISTQVELDMAIVVDRSGSMAYSVTEDTPSTTFYPPYSAPPDWEFGDPAPPDCRWRDTLAAIQAFLDDMGWTPQDEKITVLTYASSSTTDVDFTTGYESVATAMDTYTQAFDSGATNIHAGITGGINALSTSTSARAWATKAIIVLTDGRQTAGSDPVYAAQSAASQGITVYTVTFSDEADQYKMQQVADAGYGKHFHANTPGDLVNAFREIAKQLPTLITH